MLVDSHCHLDYADFTEGVPEIVGRAKDAGVGHMMTICTQVAFFDKVWAIANAFPTVYCTVGTHPHHAGEEAEAKLTRADIVALTKKPKVVGIGETGLDYYYNHSTHEAQHKSFTTHIEAALETDLPLVIHTRDAEDDTIRFIRDVGGGKARGVMHCFSGTQKLADAALDLGFYISFSGIVTFKKSDELRDVLKTVPMDRLLVETDSPYLAPMPHRGKRNEPAFVVHTAHKVAEVKGVSAIEVEKRTTENFFNLFNGAKA